ncbi:hypothetical protein NA78x_002298 [Anatilimnocola sp. NA78]|uniref:hypothetical protein n=1 Tax=Anatilimnocola sp. NA78 TaxID=3415683 RepID=UPI003CE574DC
MSTAPMIYRPKYAIALLLASIAANVAAGQQPASDDPFAPAPAAPQAPAPVAPAAPANADDPFAPKAAPVAPPTVAPAPAVNPPIIPLPQPAVQPVPTPRPANPAPVIPVPVNPAPVNPAADGANYGPAGTQVIVVTVPARQYPWGNTGGTWVPFYYNKQWHLYRSWCQ